MKKNITVGIPKHVGIIMDGNRRWARAHGLRVILGHRRAADKVIEPIVEKAAKMKIPFLTFWAFSTENWRRDSKEIAGLMKVFRHALETKLQRLKEKGVKIKVLGDPSKFPEDIRKKVEQAVAETAQNDVITVNFALNYGGREEIVRAIKRLATRNTLARNTLEKITEEEFEKYLDTAGQPDPDLIIRTGGEQRLSGFLTWQSVYSELYFTETLFPDFSPEEFEKAIEDYQKRQRRFGK